MYLTNLKRDVINNLHRILNIRRMYNFEKEKRKNPT